MFSGVRKRFTYANVVATLAMVFAMSGGAYAASKILITSSKQIKPSVLAQLKGKAGATGAQGPAGSAGSQGPAGANGKDGANGVNGTDGKEGVSPTGTAFAGTSHGCSQGGVEFKGANITFACNGKDGTTGFTETLPSGKTETGAWSFGPYEEGSISGPYIFAPVASFAIPLAARIPAVNCETVEAGHVAETCRVHYIDPAGKEVIINKELEFQELESPECPGQVAEPKAEPGNLCIYAAREQNTHATSGRINDPSIVPGPTTETVGAGKAGAIVAFNKGAGATAAGTWAVTSE